MITTYHVVVGAILTAVVSFNKIVLKASSRYYIYSIVWLFVAIFVGLRFEVGGDWSSYLRKFQNSQSENLTNVILINKDIGYALLIFFAHKINVGIWFPNLICALLFVMGYKKLNLTSSQPGLFLFICFPYIITIVAMGYSRQSAAIGCGILALTYFYEKKFTRFVFFYLLAISFHKFAFVLGVFTLPVKLLIPITLLTTFAVGPLLKIPILNIYLMSDYANASEGAEVRATITLIAGLYFLFFLRNKNLVYKDLMLKTSVLSIILFIISFHFGTAADRIGLYFAYLQPLALSEFNSQYSKTLNSALFICIIISYLALFVIWFEVSENVHTWTPYQFYL